MPKLIVFLTSTLLFVSVARAADTDVCDRSPPVVKALEASLKKKCDAIFISDLVSAAYLVLDQPNVSFDLTEHDLAGLVNLKSLRISQMNVKFIGRPFDNLQSLEALNIFYSVTTNFPQSPFEKLTNLKDLDLTTDHFTNLPDDFFKGLEKLQRLALDGNPLASFPKAALKNLHSLSSLWMSNTAIQEIPAGAFEGLNLLSTLRLNDDHISTLAPDAFSTLHLLTELYLHGNKINSISSATFAELNSLETLDLSDNQITEMPPEFPPLLKLNSFSFSYFGARPLQPGFLRNCPHVTTFSIELNGDFNEMPQDLVSYAPELMKLNLSGRGTNFIPENFLINSSKLQELTIYGGGLSELPADLLSHSPSLYSFDLEDRRMTTLPEDFFAHNRELKTLYISVRIDSVPAKLFSNLSNLESLDFNSTGLRSLPAGLFDELSSVTSLGLSAARLTKLPANIFKSMKSLIKLDLRSNSFSPEEENRIKAELPPSVDVSFK